jgi:hypothetical protein
MNARLLLAFGLALAGLGEARCDNVTPVPTSTSNDYSEVTCSTRDDTACVDTLQLATDTREALGPLLQLGSEWRFPVHIHVVTPDDPLAAKISHPAAQVLLQDNTMVIDAYVPIGDPDAREFIQRQYVTAMLWERFFAKTKTFDQNTALDVVPLWLIEGLREWVNEDPTHNREAIARRALLNQTAPTLAEITGWKKLSDDRLLGLWQRAFSFYLVDSMVRGGARRDDFQQWLDSFSSPGGSGKLHFPTEANWREELANASARGHNAVYTWHETADDLAVDETITYAESKKGKVETCTIETVTDKPRNGALLQAVQEKIDVLTELEWRAHPSWHSTLEAYRTALMAFLNEDTADRTPRLIAEAHALRAAEVEHHQKLVDYLNWFEVTHDFGVTTSRFRAYFTAAKRLEAVVADPSHPDPIRANLLQVESHL